MGSFKNGSLTRERIRDQLAHSSWEEFDALLACTPPGNNGNIAMYFDHEEIIPRGVQGTFCFDSQGNTVSEGFEHAATDVRAVIEGQMLAKRVHAESLGFRIGKHGTTRNWFLVPFKCFTNLISKFHFFKFSSRY